MTSTVTPLLATLRDVRRCWWVAEGWKGEPALELARSQAGELQEAASAFVQLLGEDALDSARVLVGDIGKGAGVAVDVLSALRSAAEGNPLDKADLTGLVERSKETSPLDGGSVLDRVMLAELAEDEAYATAMLELAARSFGDDWRVVLTALARASLDSPLPLDGPIQRLRSSGAEGVDAVVAACEEVEAGSYALMRLVQALPADLQEQVIVRAGEHLPGDSNVMALRAGYLVDHDRAPEALPLTRELVARHGEIAPFQSLHARALLGVGERDEAVAALRVAVASPIPYASAAELLAGVLVEESRHAEALEVVRAMLERAPTLSLHHSEILMLLELERVDEIEPAVVRTLDAYPTDAGALVTLVGLAGSDPERLAAARQRLEQAIKLEPEQASHHALLAKVLRADDRPREAIETLDRAITLGADGAEQHEARAELLWQVDRKDEAIAAYLRLGRRDRVVELITDVYDQQPPATVLRWLDALGSDPGPAELALRSEVLRLLGRATDSLAAAEAARAAYRADPPPVWLIGTQAQVLLDLGHHAEAVACIEEAFTREPEYWFGRAVEVMAYSWLERYGDAETVLDTHFSAEDLVDAWRLWRDSARGQLLLETARLEEADRYLEPRAEGDTDLAAVLGAVRSRLGRHDDAVELMRRGQETLNAGWLVELANAAARRDLPKSQELGPDARAVYEQAISFAEALPEMLPAARVSAAWAYLVLGEVPAAIERFALDPGPVATDRARAGFAMLASGDASGATSMLEGVRSHVNGMVDGRRRDFLAREVRADLELLQALGRFPSEVAAAVDAARRQWPLEWPTTARLS